MDNVSDTTAYWISQIPYQGGILPTNEICLVMNYPTMGASRMPK